jgi:hypothetical protein
MPDGLERQALGISIFGYFLFGILALVFASFQRRISMV